MKRPSLSNQSGNVILVTLSAIATLSTCLAVTLTLTQTMTRNVQRTSRLQQAIALGDGTLELAFTNWREICKQQYSVHLPTSSFANISLPSGGSAADVDFPGLSPFAVIRTPATSTQNVTIANYRVQAVDPQITVANGESTLAADTPPPNSTGRNVNETSVFYLASADVTLPAIGKAGKVTAKMRRVFEKQRTSPFNCAIFYTDTLEIHPGPIFYVTGPVHTNGKLYTGHDTLNFMDKTTYVDDWSIGFSPSETSHSSETPQAPHFPSDLPPARDVAQQPIGMDSTRIFNPGDRNPNNDSYREFIERPDLSYPDPIEDVRYYDQAGVRVLVDASNVVSIRKKNGTGETVLSSSSTGADKTLYDGVMAAISTNVTIADNREQKDVRLVTLDIKKLNETNYNNTAYNNIIYVTDTSATASTRRGVRLKNGEILKSGGLTVASDNPMYIQGDYNTGSYTADPASNATSNPDLTKPTVAGYTRQPAAVAADAVMILSNNWNDSNNDLSNRAASNTTVNTAILSGIVPSNGGNYSGGAENFPRFMENWAGDRLTYYGSMVELFQSQQATGTWGKGNVYSAPDRRWYFDTNFYADPPPGSLVLTLYIKQRWFLE